MNTSTTAAIVGLLVGFATLVANAQLKIKTPSKSAGAVLKNKPNIGSATKKVGKSKRPLSSVGDIDQTKPLPKFLIDRQLLAAGNVDDWIEALPDWNHSNRKRADRTRTSDAGGGTEKEDGRNYNVTRTKYSITDTPEEIVTFQPVNGFWLGSIVQEKGLQLGLGSMQEVSVPATKRATFNVSSDLPLTKNYRTIPNPSSSTVSSAIGALRQSGNSSNWGGSRTMHIVENYSEEQTAFDLGLSGHYLTASMKASLQSDQRHSRHTITAAFIEKAFTVQADFEGRTRREAFFRDGFTLTDAKALTNQGRVTATNLPAYIKSITYGRVVLFNLTSTLDESQMKEAVNAAVNGLTWGVNANFSGSQASKNTAFELRVTTIGGPQSTFNKLIPATGIKDALQVMNSYLSQSAPLSTMEPISYTANTLRDDQLAALSTTTEYTVTKSVPNPIGERYTLKMWLEITKVDDGGDNDLECFGTLRMNGDTWWSVSRDERDRYTKQKNESIDISTDTAHNYGKKFEIDTFYDSPAIYKLALDVKDGDKTSGDDTITNLNLNLNFGQMGPGDYTWNWKQADGKGSRTTLHIRVERQSYL